MTIHFAHNATGARVSPAELPFVAPRKTTPWLLVTLEALAVFGIVALVAANVL
jgi:hypothetical protein